jgi:hypothetical protein
MIYGLLVLKTGISRSADLFYLVAIVIAGSITICSLTGVLVARWFRELGELPAASPGSESTSQASLTASSGG